MCSAPSFASGIRGGSCVRHDFAPKPQTVGKYASRVREISPLGVVSGTLYATAKPLPRPVPLSESLEMHTRWLGVRKTRSESALPKTNSAVLNHNRARLSGFN